MRLPWSLKDFLSKYKRQQDAHEHAAGRSRRRLKNWVGILLIAALLLSSLDIVLTEPAPVYAAPAAITQNLYYNLATDTLSDWTPYGSGIRTGIKLQSGGNTLAFSRSDLTLDDKAFLIEAVVSAEGLGADGERGARFWAWFVDSAALPPGDVYQADIRLTRTIGVTRVELFDTASGHSKASLDADWTNSGYRLRIRLKRQQVAGVDYIFLQAEPSSGWDDPASPNNLADPPRSKGVLLSSFTSGPGSSEVGFGNHQAGVYYSEWESIHVTTAADLTTVLPYWPPKPTAPTLVHDNTGAGNPQGVNFSDNLAGLYLANDSATPVLDANETTLSGEARTNPGDEHWYFNGLNDNQTVQGRVKVSDVSGRTTASDDTSLAIHVAGALTGVTDTPANRIVGVTTTHNVGFTTASDTPSDGQVTVVFPAGFDVSGATLASVTGFNGDCVASVNGQTVTVMRSGGTETAGGTPVTMALSGIVNTSVPGTAYKVTVSVRRADGSTIDGPAASARFTIDPVFAPGITQNLFYSLGQSLDDWTVHGSGLRTGFTLQSNGNTLTYDRIDLPVDGRAFQVESVISAQSLTADGERGARFWAWFGDPGISPGNVYQIEVRLTRVSGTNRLELYDAAAGTSKAFLEFDWTNTGDRPRVRLKRQQVSGVDYIFLQAEGSNGWDDPSQPNNLADAHSQAVPLSSFSYGPGTSIVGFGNAVSGTYYSEWASVHLTTAGDLATILPYWPPKPAPPLLVQDDKGPGNPQGLYFSANIISIYNDWAEPFLEANGGMYGGDAEKRVHPGNEQWYFGGLNDNQVVRGRVLVSDVSHRMPPLSDYGSLLIQAGPVNTPIPAIVDIDPNTLNLKSQGDKNAFTAYIELPTGYDVGQISVSTVKLVINGVTISAQTTPTSVGDYDRDKVPDRMVKFARQGVITALGGQTGDISMTVTGQLNDGRVFTGSDTIKVIKPGK
jgi:hypothetical protein